ARSGVVLHASPTRRSSDLVTNGGGLLRYDGGTWQQVDGTLRSLTNVACSPDAAYAVGLLGAILIGDEQTRQIRSTDVTTQDLFRSEEHTSELQSRVDLVCR